MKHALLFLLLVPVTFTYRYIDASIAGRVPHYTSASESERVPLHTTAAAFGQEQLQAAAAASEKVRLSFASPAPGREQLLEGALLNRYLELIGSTLQRPFGCGKIAGIKRLGDPRLPAFEVVIEVVTFGEAFGQPPYDLVSLTVRDRPDLVSLTGIEKQRNLSEDEYKNRCRWFVQ
ncbi:hypothetical protein BBOR36S_01043 [Brevibacillus borstelensis]